jgi:hypothetical protein
MRKLSILVLCTVSLLLLSSCSPRDFLTRRLAADLIAGSDTFRTPQLWQLNTGIISNKDYLSPEYLLLQHRGWISATKATCLPAVAPPPCWNTTLTPSGVDTFQSLIAPSDVGKQSFSVPVARRELITITGIAKQGNVADVEFDWKWIPMNEVGALLHPTDVGYQSTASFRCYDDGWRLVERVSRPAESFDEALRNAEPAR